MEMTFNKVKSKSYDKPVIAILQLPLSKLLDICPSYFK